MEDTDVIQRLNMLLPEIDTKLKLIVKQEARKWSKFQKSMFRIAYGMQRYPEWQVDNINYQSASWHLDKEIIITPVITKFQGDLYVMIELPVKDSPSMRYLVLIPKSDVNLINKANKLCYLVNVPLII